MYFKQIISAIWFQVFLSNTNDFQQELFLSLVDLGVQYAHCISEKRLDSHNEYPRQNTQQSGGKFAVMLEFRGMQCTPSLPSLPGPL